jgi:hypothetical protein
VVQLPGAERADGLVQSGTDPRHLGLADARVDPHGFDQIVDRPGGDTVDVGLHHHHVQGMIDAAAGLEDDREERALPQLGYPQVDIAGLGRQLPRAVAIAFGHPGLGALIGQTGTRPSVEPLSSVTRTPTSSTPPANSDSLR